MADVRCDNPVVIIPGITLCRVHGSTPMSRVEGDCNPIAAKGGDHTHLISEPEETLDVAGARLVNKPVGYVRDGQGSIK